MNINISKPDPYQQAVTALRHPLFNHDKYVELIDAKIKGARKFIKHASTDVTNNKRDIEMSLESIRHNKEVKRHISELMIISQIYAPTKTSRSQCRSTAG